MLSEIDMSLSFRMTITFSRPTLFIASKAMPAVMAPSPMIATALRLDPLRRAATAMPSAAEMEVEEWAVPKVS